MTKLENLGLQLQKFGANLKLIADLTNNTVRHMAVLFAVVRVLKNKNIITDEEIEAELRSKENV